jgi:uncharacterized Tic20 family protein
VPQNQPAPVRRGERVLLFMIASALGLSVICIVALIIGRATGVIVANGIWQVVIVLPLIGFPIGLLLMIAYLVTTIIRRSREAKDA